MIKTPPLHQKGKLVKKEVSQHCISGVSEGTTEFGNLLERTGN